MKYKHLIPVAIIALGILSCNNKKKEIVSDVPIATVVKEAEKEGKSTRISSEQVPDSVLLLFNKRYPAATKVVWMKYEPVESDDLDMDDSYYYVTYYNSGGNYTSWYNNQGAWVKTSTRITGNPNLPDAVNKTINAQYPGYKITEIDKENDKDRDLYEVELHKGEAKAKLKILPDGTIVKRKEKN